MENRHALLVDADLTQGRWACPAGAAAADMIELQPITRGADKL